MVCEKKQKVLSRCKESIGTCLTPNTTEASDISSCINAPALAYAYKNKNPFAKMLTIRRF